MRLVHGEYAACPVVRHQHAAYIARGSAARFLLPCRVAAFPPLWNPWFCIPLGSALTSGAFFSQHHTVCGKRMADMSDTLLSTRLVGFICLPVAAAFPNSSSLGLVSRHPDCLETSSLDQSNGRAHPPPALCPLIGPVPGQGLFFFAPTVAADRLSLLPAHGWHVHNRIADQTVKIYISPCRWNAAPYPPPSDPREATPNRSRILLPRPRFTGPVQSSSLHSGLTLDLASALS